KGHHAAVRSVAFKWIRILFACWKQRTPYDPQRYLKDLQQPGSPLANLVNNSPQNYLTDQLRCLVLGFRWWIVSQPQVS
ncbi:MAG TPA: hypothetical protein VHY59_10950, partial [Chthoniobacterales bacterium]|nr:hypothetical protein [Chthoniobacterales bacterium]